jgi:hypothetical protein
VADVRGGSADWQLAERAEAAYMASYISGPGREAADACGITVAHVGGGVVWATTGDPSGGFFSRAVGQGVTEPITGDVLDAIVDIAKSAGAPMISVQPSPEVVTPEVFDLLAERGFNPGRTWDKLGRDASPPPAAATDLRVDVIGPDDASDFASVLLAGFGMPELFRPFGEAQVVMPGWSTYGAFDGDTLVGTGAMYMENGLACLSGAATFEHQRGRGAQRALMSRRIADAAAAGVRYIATETGSETDDSPNPSLHNMHWAGFTTLYLRRNYNKILAARAPISSGRTAPPGAVSTSSGQA